MTLVEVRLGNQAGAVAWTSQVKVCWPEVRRMEVRLLVVVRWAVQEAKLRLTAVQ